MKSKKPEKIEETKKPWTPPVVKEIKIEDTEHGGCHHEHDGCGWGS